MSAPTLAGPPTPEERAFAEAVDEQRRSGSGVGWGIEIRRRRADPVYLLRCSGCGTSYQVSARTRRDMRASGRDPVCGMCRRPARIRTTKAMHDYWLERFTIAEIVEMAEAWWGPRERWQKPA